MFSPERVAQIESELERRKREEILKRTERERQEASRHAAAQSSPPSIQGLLTARWRNGP